MLSTILIQAQDPGYKGPAKMNVNSFWRQVETLKSGKGGSMAVSNLEKAMAGVKEKDPSYNTSAMETEIKVWKEKYSNDAAIVAEEEKKQKEEQNASKQALYDAVANDAILRYLFREKNIQVGTNNLSTIEKDIEDYKAKTKKVLETKIDPNASKLKPEAYINYINKFNETTDRFIKDKEDYMKEITSTEDVKGMYYEMQFYQAYWDAAQKILPQQTAYATAYEKITALINKTGSIEQIEAVAKKNNAEKIKNTKLPPAVLKDANLEKMLIDAFNKRYKDEFNGTAIKAIVLQSDWHTERKEITNAITGRSREGAVVYKGTDGKCYLVKSMYLYQEYISGSFQNTKATYGNKGQEMLCENVK